MYVPIPGVRVGSSVERIDTVHFLAGYHRRETARLCPLTYLVLCCSLSDYPHAGSGVVRHDIAYLC